MIDFDKAFKGRTPLALDLSIDNGTTPFFTISFKADDRFIALAFEWSSRCQRWVVDATYADDNTPIVSGQIVELYKDLFEYAQNRPTGVLVPMTLAGTLAAPGLGELGTRVGIYYLAAST